MMKPRIGDVYLDEGESPYGGKCFIIRGYFEEDSSWIFYPQEINRTKSNPFAGCVHWVNMKILKCKKINPNIWKLLN